MTPVNPDFMSDQNATPSEQMLRWTACHRFVRMLSGRWKIEIFALLFEQPQRFGDLRRRLPEISAQSLTVQLHDMEGDGLIRRIEGAAGRPHYSLTVFARSLDPLFAEITARSAEGPARPGIELRKAA